MNIFVLSWFAPNHHSQEGFSLLKLMKNSGNQFYVCCNESDESVRKETGSNAPGNIKCIFLNESNAAEWAEAGIKEFEALSKETAFDCFITVSLPAESIKAGEKIKEIGGIKWIAMLDYPVAGEPSETEQYQLNKELETSLRKTADLIVAPSSELFKYILGSDHWMPKFKVIPPCIDESLFAVKGKSKRKETEKISFTAFATKENGKSLEAVIRAVRKLKESSSPALNKIAINVIGDYCPGMPHMALNYYLDDVIGFTHGTDYSSFRKAAEESDWVIHLDEYHEEAAPLYSTALDTSLADSIGCGVPVLAVTKNNTPSYNLAELAGGLTCGPDDIIQIALTFEEIAAGRKTSGENYLGEKLTASTVANDFDNSVEALCSKKYTSKRTTWPQIKESCDDKILSVCIPSYNAQVFLDRCIYSLIDHEMAPFVEVIVVNDGSKDHTLEIGREYEARYPGIVRVVDKENGGHGSTINRAIKEAKGLFFKNVDSDDWVDSGNLAKLIKYLSENKDIDAISSDYDEIDLETGVETAMCAGESIEYGKVYTFGTVKVEDIYFTIHSLTIKTSILKEMGIELQHHTFFVDCEYILFPVPSIKKFVFLPDHVYKYSRGNPEQSVDITNMVRRYDHHDRVIRRCIEYGNKASLDTAQKAYYDATLKRILWTHFALSLVYDEDKARGLERAKDFYGFLKENRPDLAAWTIKGVWFFKAALDCKFDPKAFERQQKIKAVAAGAGNKAKRIYQRFRNA